MSPPRVDNREFGRASGRVPAGQLPAFGQLGISGRPFSSGMIFFQSAGISNWSAGIDSVLIELVVIVNSARVTSPGVAAAPEAPALPLPASAGLSAGASEA